MDEQRSIYNLNACTSVAIETRKFKHLRKKKTIYANDFEPTVLVQWWTGYNAVVVRVTEKNRIFVTREGRHICYAQ